VKLPRAEQGLEEWQTAIGCLIGAAEGRDFMMHARRSIGMSSGTIPAAKILVGDAGSRFGSQFFIARPKKRQPFDPMIETGRG
jgi:hypothetical protein